jgi:type VI secretion system protein ImpH
MSSYQKLPRPNKPAIATRIDELLAQWKDHPWNADYFALLRRLENVAPEIPRLGCAVLPSDEMFRIGQEPSMIFAPATFSRFEPANDYRPPLLRQYFFGYLGPNGPLPTHLTEFIQLRYLNHGDPTWLGFLDALNHRFALYFYRAWAQAQPAVSSDRPETSSFRFEIGSLIGQGLLSSIQRDHASDDAKLFFTGLLSRQVHNAETIESVLSHYFGLTVKVEQWVGRWLTVPPEELTRLGSNLSKSSGEFAKNNQLGFDAMIGQKVWDRQHRIRLLISPLTIWQFRKFLPNGDSIEVLRSWMIRLVGHELAWDARLILDARQVPASTLNKTQLGWDSWLGKAPRTADAIEVEISESESFSK